MTKEDFEENKLRRNWLCLFRSRLRLSYYLNVLPFLLKTKKDQGIFI